MMNKKLLWSFSILLIWLGTTLFLDFIVIKKVVYFSTDLFQAGSIALNIFESYNFFELLCATICLILLWNNHIALKIIHVFLAIISCLYVLFLTPQISQIKTQWEQSLAGNSPQAHQLQLDHQFFHSQYILFDTLKIIIILISLVIIYRKLIKEPIYGNRNS
jgi:hypothetical protein